MKTWLLVAFIFSSTFGVCDELSLKRISKGDKVEAGHIYYQISRDDRVIRMSIINTYGDAVFAKKDSLKISSITIDISDEGLPYFMTTGGQGSNGPVDYVRLGYETHSGGRYCGCMMYHCTPLRYPFHHADLDPNDKIRIKAYIPAYFGDLSRQRTLIVDCNTTVGDIPLTISKKDSGNATEVEGSADQPATAPSPELESNKKIKPESEVSPQ